MTPPATATTPRRTLAPAYAYTRTHTHTPMPAHARTHTHTTASTHAHTRGRGHPRHRSPDRFALGALTLYGFWGFPGCGVGRGFVVQLFVGAVYPPALHVHAFWRSFGGRCTTPVVVGLGCGYRVAGRWLAPRVWRGRIAVVRWHCLSEVQVRVLFALLSSRSVGGRLLCGVALV